MQSKLKILFIDDHNGLREGMIFLLKNKNPSFEISGVSNVEEGIELLSKDKDISLVILDLNLDGENSLEKIPAIKKANPKVSILVYTMYNSEHQVANAVRCDIQGFITKESAVEELEQAIVAISKGNTYFNNVASKVINEVVVGLALGGVEKDSLGPSHLNELGCGRGLTYVLKKMFA